MKRFLYFNAILIATLFFQSCKINSEFMFQTPDDFVFDTPVLDSLTINYRIQPGDILSFELYTNEAAIMLEVTTGTTLNTDLKKTNIQYVVDLEGMVEFPIIGNQKIGGLTLGEAKKNIEALYDFQFINPYVQLRVLNRRVLVFGNPPGMGKVLTLGSETISVIEAIANAGGIGGEALADDVRLIRYQNGVRTVYNMDLSTIEGTKYAMMSVESGDIIYLQRRKNIAQQIAADFRTYTILLSSLVVFYTLSLTITN
jgi:polysaccharide export outer membrane protein